MAIKKSIIELIRKTKEYIIEKYNYVVIKVDTDFIGCMYENDNYFIFFISENQGGKFIFNYREDFTRKDSTKKDITNMQFEEVKKLIDKYMIKADHLNNLLIYPRKKLKYSKIISDSNQNDSTYGLYENIKINDINISTRLKNVLISKNIDNLKKFMELEEKEIMSFKNVGAATIDEFINIKKKLNINPNDFTKIMIKKDINKKDILEKFEKELDQSKINILFGNLSLEKYGFKNKTVSDLKGIGIKNISDVVLKPYNEIKTSQNITKSCKDKILEIKLDFYKKLDFSDDTSDFLLTVIENIGYKTMTLPFLKNLLILNSDYPVRKLSDDISILKKKDKITYNTDGVCLKREKLLDYIDKNLKDNEKEIILYRLSGKTLQEIGDEFGLTKERIRQKVKKILSTIEYVEEDKFKNLFTEYNFSLEDFKKIFNENDQTFFYLKEKYENGKKLIAAGINDIRFNDNQINTITEICNLTIINGNVIELSKQGIIKDLIKRYAKKTIKIEEFVEKYNKFVIEHSELNLEKVNLRSMEGYLDRSNNVIFSIEKNFRFYDYDNIDEQYINQVKDLYNIEKGYYSSMVLFANNRSLMKNIDIHDEYELHSFSKRFLSLSEDVKFDRNPCFSIGNVTKKDFIQEKIIELSPISTSDFLQNIENDYGHKKSTLMAYLLQEFKELICNNQIDYNIESLSIDEVQNLKQIFCEPIYNIDDVKKILKENGYANYEKILNSLNMYKLGYKIRSSYIIDKEISSIEDYLKKISLSRDFFQNENFLKNSTYNSMIKKLERSFDFILISNDRFITIKKLNEIGISKQDIYKFTEDVCNEFKDDIYFSLKNVRDRINIEKLDEYGFEDVFLESIIANIEEVSSLSIMGNKIFSIANQQITIQNFISYNIGNDISIKTDELIERINENYGILLTQEKIKNSIAETEMYYSDILEKIYLNKGYYYEEVYKYE